MDHLLRQNEEGTNHTDEKVRHEINTLISAGSETNALAICFTLIMLAMNPEIQVIHTCMMKWSVTLYETTVSTKSAYF